MEVEHIEIHVDSDTNLLEVFNLTYNNVLLNTLREDAPDEARHALLGDFLGGIAVGRESFEELFKHEVIFGKKKKKVQVSFLNQLQTVQLEAMAGGNRAVAQGLSCFSLWVASIVMDRPEDKKVIEKTFFGLADKLSKGKGA